MSSKSFLALSFVLGILGLTLWYSYDSASNISNGPPIALAEGARLCVETHNDRTDQGQCFYDLAQSLDGHYSPAEYQAYLDTETDRRVLINCHELLHYVGWQAFRDTGSVGDAFAIAIPSCNQGMYHGIVEEYIKSINFDVESAVPVLLGEACTDGETAADKQANAGGVCYHGVGHGLMFITQNDLPRSLDLCDQVPAGNEESCYTGALMENLDAKAVGSSTEQRNPYYDPTDPTYPCRLLDSHQQAMCYQYEASNLLNVFDMDPEAWFAHCEEFPSEYRMTCYRGVGVNIPAPSIPPAETTPLCEPALQYGEPAYQACIGGVHSSLDSHHNGSPDALAVACAQVPAEQKAFCYTSGVYEFREWWSGKKADEVCMMISNQQAAQDCSAAHKN